MISEQLSRSQLQRQVQARLQELRQQGQDAPHLRRFLEKLRAVDGQTVGDMCHYWSRMQAERRPLYQLLWLAVSLLASTLLLKTAGAGAALAALVVSGGLALYHLNWLWESENSFTNELLARADAVQVYLARPPI